jgi:uncharacterized protein (DUF362 family)
MPKPIVAIVPYQQPLESVRRAIRSSQCFDALKPGARVFIKPNIVYWSVHGPFPKWGVITTSRVVEDMVVLLKAYGIDDITIGEGMVSRPTDRNKTAHAFDALGYNRLNRRYGVKTVDVMERPFEKVDLGDDIRLNFNSDILASDFVVNLPVLKTHVQTVVSLGIKNLKGAIDMPSRKRCHNPDPVKDLHFRVSRLADKMPPMCTLIDGIYTNERGPGPDGRIFRSNLLIASSDVLSADMVGARVLGHAPETVPHLKLAAANRGRPLDLSDIEQVGEQIEDVAFHHEYEYDYQQADDGAWLPAPFLRQGIRGVSYRRYDTTMCTYCSSVNGLALAAIRSAWKGKAWDKVEILTGKRMQPTPGMHKTILIGQCMYKAHRSSSVIKEMIPVKGCPPEPEDIRKALRQTGIEAEDSLFKEVKKLPSRMMRRYENRPEYEETLFQVT